jgi:hypothetical protein
VGTTQKQIGILDRIYRMLNMSRHLKSVITPPDNTRGLFHYNWSGGSRTFKKNKRKGL